MNVSSLHLNTKVGQKKTHESSIERTTPSFGKVKAGVQYTKSTCSIKIWQLSMYTMRVIAFYVLIFKVPYEKVVSQKKKNSFPDVTNLFIFRFFFKISALCPYMFIPSLLPLHPCQCDIEHRRHIPRSFMMFSMVLFEQFIIAAIWRHVKKRPFLLRVRPVSELHVASYVSIAMLSYVPSRF